MPPVPFYVQYVCMYVCMYPPSAEDRIICTDLRMYVYKYRHSYVETRLTAGLRSKLFASTSQHQSHLTFSMAFGIKKNKDKAQDGDVGQEEQETKKVRPIPCGYLSMECYRNRIGPCCPAGARGCFFFSSASSSFFLFTAQAL